MAVERVFEFVVIIEYNDKQHEWHIFKPTWTEAVDYATKQAAMLLNPFFQKQCDCYIKRLDNEKQVRDVRNYRLSWRVVSEEIFPYAEL